MTAARMPRRWTLAALALALAACDGEGAADGGLDAAAPAGDAGPDAQVTDAQVTDAAPPDGAAPPDAGPGVETVEVSHAREIRGVWIATVYNINWPSSSRLDAAAQRAELDGLLDTARAAGMNSVFLQVRAESDAFYRSELEPWSRFLTGTPGRDPGWDPLAYAVDAAHARGLELHAWMNPYRALVSGEPSAAASTHIVNARPDLVVRYGSLHWMDPGNPEGRAHVLAVIRDVLTRYDLDGLHFDDYFYPYPESGVAFPDDATFAAYGGGLSRPDWRRQNVNTMVREVHELVRAVRPDVRFGISPFGIYRPDMPPGIRGLDQYAALFADPLAWMEGGHVDYIAPQLYWPTTQTAQDYARLLEWWSERADATGRTLVVGNYLAQLGSSAAWSLEEIRTQLRLVRDEPRAHGNIQYHIGPITTDRMGVRAALAAHHATPAATPALVDRGPAPSPPGVTVAGSQVTLTGEGRCFAAYREVGGAFRIERLIFASSATLSRGRWAISRIARDGTESRGVVVTIADGGEPPPEGMACTHSFGGRYAHTACSASYQCCDGAWRMRTEGCGACRCVEESGSVGCE
ncbi:MAG: family 10 glycosylhydrolase [Sandaracinaceae bacterium]|nr:family 10 glycosylhydrolase [Sandaracinaceae bacterium]